MSLEVDAWSTTAASNTTVASINIAEGCPAANINNGMRAIMAAVREWKNSFLYALSGANTDITGLITGIALTESGTIGAATIGYRGIPSKQTGGALTLALTDAGGRIRLTSGGLIIPANASVAFPDGTTIVVVNRSGAAQTISITTDTLYLGGVGSTGARTLDNFGIATLVKDASTEWLISGLGLT